MKVRYVRVMLSLLCGAILIGVLVAVAPIGGAAAPEPSLARAGPFPPHPGAGPTPADPALPSASPFGQARLHPALRRALQVDGGCKPVQSASAAAQPPATGRGDRASTCFLSIIIEWRRASEIADQVETAPDRPARRQQLVTELQREAQHSSALLGAALADAADKGQARNVRSFWASPIIALEAQPDLIDALSQRNDVVQIRLDEPIYLERIPFQTAAPLDGSGALPWNLQMLDVDLAAGALRLDGTGVVVANLDTGVDWQHPALLKKYRGYRSGSFAVHRGNWHVSTGEPYLYPGDGDGHGTHTMGTIVGDDDAGNRLGVAPGARWIAVKIFDNEGMTYESWIHDAFQWILAPEGDPALAPDVISNSWGTDVGADERFRPDLAVLRAAGILPIFSAGNLGPDAGTLNSPASLPEALAVGAVDDEGLAATFSSRGPSAWGEVKPELVAPGVNIVSSFPGGGLAKGTGTSMAAPHVAGLAALLLQAKPDLGPGQIEHLLESTSVPLETTVPNNTSGWGLVNAYAAALQVISSGKITGRVEEIDGKGIPHAAVSVLSRDGTQRVSSSSDAGGAFAIALRPGLYDVTAKAFGFDSTGPSSVEVRSDSQATVTLTLAAQPVGSFHGRVTDLETGDPISATIAVEGTPVVVSTISNTGQYSLKLPAGHYTASVVADAHRTGHLDLPVTPGLDREIDVALRAAPRILLVDSGRWYYESEIRYFEDALTSLDYPFDLWTVRDPFGLSDGSGDRPTAEALALYDIVVWSSPQDSPGLITTDAVLVDYLAGGGQLLVSGQDVAFWDGGGSPVYRAATYFTGKLGLQFNSEGNLRSLDGVPGTPFTGLAVTLNTADSARQQRTPDAVAIRDRRVTQPILRWPDGATGGVTTGTCRDWRAVWLGFGLEGAGPRSTRTDLLGRSLDWLASPPAPYGLLSTSENASLIGLPGTAVSHTIRLDNIGTSADTVDLQVDGGPWPIDLELPDGRHVDAAGEFTLDSCAGGPITATVTIPPGQPRNARSTHSVRFASRGDPGSSVAITVTTKTPAPILLVDDERWYNHQDQYTKTLDALDLSYDLYDAQNRGCTPTEEMLQGYPLVVWTTGYDWFEPLTADDEAHLSTYLDSGGRLLLSSQDTLDIRGLSEFTRERLGVAEASVSVTSTEVVAIPGSPLGSDLGPWDLTFPFVDWSDGLSPSEQARGTLQNEQLLTVGVVRPAPDWRTAFFSFPLETLADAPRQMLLERALVWLSPLGESQLEAPPVAAEGSRVPITLTLGLATSSPRTGLRAELSLPPQANLAPGSLRGSWHYNDATRRLAWSGDLTPDQRVVMGADLELATGIADGTELPLRARLYAGDGLTVTADSPVHVDMPWLELEAQAAPFQAKIHETVQYTFTVTNAGVAPATGHFTDTLPAGLEPLAGSAWSSTGEPTVEAQGLSWTGTLAPGASAAISYRAKAGQSRPGAWLTDRAELTDQFGRRVVAWASVKMPTWLSLPLLWKDAP